MEYRSAKGFNGWGQLGVLLACLGAGFILTEFSTVLLGLKMLGPSAMPFHEKLLIMEKAFFKPENSNYAQFAQFFAVLFLLFLPSIAFILICHKDLAWAGFSKHFTLLQIVVGAIIIFATSPFAEPFADLSKLVLSHFPHWDLLAKNAEDEYNQAVQSMTALTSWSQFFMGVFIIAFLPAMFEELFFRGVLQNLLVRWWKMPLLAIIVTSILFSLAHSSYYLFLTRIILGFVLGLLYYYSKNIWVNIFAHFMNNLMALIQVFYINTTTKKIVPIDDMDSKMPYWSLIITFTILAALFIWFKRISEENGKKIKLEEAELEEQNYIN
ncbi:MAG TPA: CPBP family intramembrane glutamic endopeptidase [Ferruginibacter sp.]|nr:CPBP family intramembrane glutamic endopeptidase [Ferruginibacter sp.]